MYNSIRPGQIWLDNEGKRIHAHGGSIITADDTFYWYGENKEMTTPGSGIWHMGVRLYSSKDLYNWKDEGIIMPPSDDPEDPLHPNQCMDRPHILYNRKTGLFVMWMKIMGKDGIQYQTIATAKDIHGPFSILKTFRPLGMSCGDFDLVINPKTEKAYYIFERVHSDMIVADLTDDYTDVTGHYTEHFPNGTPPYVREAPAYFFRGGLHYIITSGTTGYYPNRSEVAVANDYHGPYTVLGDPHPDDPEHASFRSQVTSVFKHPKKENLYIALADRWLVDLPTPLPDYDGAFRKVFESDPPDWSKLAPIYGTTAENISLADYVWLPIRFDGDMAFLDWHDEWRIEDYE